MPERQSVRDVMVEEFGVVARARCEEHQARIFGSYFLAVMESQRRDFTPRNGYLHCRKVDLGVISRMDLKGVRLEAEGPVRKLPS